MMRKFAALVLVLAFAAAAQAQDVPRWELFGGYSYVRVNPGMDVDGLNLNGWNASLTWNGTRWLGLTADFSGAYGSPEVTVGTLSAEVKTRNHAFLFGPRFTYRGSDRVQPFAHVLFGAVHSHAEALGVGGGEATFGLAAGGGVDVKAGDHVAIRVIQADYLMTRFGAVSQHNARLSFGVVFRFGE